MAALETSPDGLSSATAAARRARWGPNVLRPAARPTLAAKLVRRVTDPLVAILLIAAIISGGSGDWPSVLVIVGIVGLSMAIDLAQEGRGERAVDALRRSVATHARVRRDGRLVDLAVADLVPGDIVALRAGDLVPADGAVLAARGASADESALTGEAFPAEKAAGPGTAAPGKSADTASALFAGTVLVSGEATMLTVSTGDRTHFAGIAGALAVPAARTAFEQGVHALGMVILRLTGFLVLFVLLSRLVLGGLNLETFLFAVALAVGLTPELLPMVVTVTLSRGAQRMARRQVVVKRLPAIHDLGAMDVLCTDKTGTLTQAQIAMTGAIGPSGTPSDRVLMLAGLNSRFCTGLRSALDDAIDTGAAGVPDEGWSRVDDLPFDFERRRASILLGRGHERLLVVKGAPEEVLRLCRAVEDGAATAPLDAAMRGRLDASQQERAADGARLLAIACKAMPDDRAQLAPDDEDDLVFAGFALFVDPPKPSATEAVARLAAAGVRVKVVSGDAAPVVRHLVAALGLPVRGVLAGTEIDLLTDAALIARVEETDIFARVSPDQKTRIVRALRRRGHIVGFLGDGINDAPAIHAADVGLSVDTGTAVAREAAAIVLMAPDLGVLADGVAEGRRTYANIMKYVRMGTSSNFGNMLSMAVASVALPFLPLTPLQVLLNNLLYDLSEIGIPFDRADEAAVRRPHPWRMREVMRTVFVMGPLSSLFDLATFAMLLAWVGDDVATFRTGWFVESIATQILVIFAIRTPGPAWRSRPHPVLVATSLGALALALMLALTPAGAFFGFVPLPAPLLAAIAGVTLLYLIAAEVLKRFALRETPPGEGKAILDSGQGTVRRERARM
jgi:Mg2+-importing ATPase